MLKNEQTKATNGLSLRSVKFVPGKKAGVKEDPLKEGIIEVRPGTKGIDLGEKKFALAYIRVLDDRHCFKGMCLYSDNLPGDYDIICYYRDPSQGLMVLKSVTPEMNLSKDIMTVIQSDYQTGILADPWHEEPWPVIRGERMSGHYFGRFKKLLKEQKNKGSHTEDTNEQQITEAGNDAR